METEREKLKINMNQILGRAKRQHYFQSEFVEVLPMEERIKELLKKYEESYEFHKTAVERHIKDYGQDCCEYLDHHQKNKYYYMGGISVLERLLP